MSLHVLKKKVDDLGNTTNSNCSIYITAVSCLCCRPLGGTAVCNLGVFLRSLYLPHYFRQLFQLKKKIVVTENMSLPVGSQTLGCGRVEHTHSDR